MNTPAVKRAEEAGQAIRVRRGDVGGHAVGPFEVVQEARGSAVGPRAQNVSLPLATGQLRVDS
jgi:hypothetical protein